MSTEVAYIALGSNLGDREATLRSALDTLGRTAGVRIAAVSSFLETEPEGLPGQGRYLNAAAAVRTSLSPRALLAALLTTEQAHGRRRDPTVRWGPRTLDLDLLMHGDAIIDEPGLTVPHPRMHRRSFVLVPLAEIAPRVMHPGLRRSIECLRDEAAWTGTAKE